MKILPAIIALALFNRLLLWLFPNSDEVWKYGTLSMALFAVVFIVASEIKGSRAPLD
jgi:hypothetical protein